MTFMPENYKIVRGVGKSKHPLVAFDNALRSAGIGDYNLVKVSSIIPARCREANTIALEKGSILYAAYSTTTLYDEKTSYVGVAVALPENKEESGVIFECCSECDPSSTLHDMCSEAMSNRSKVIAHYFDCIQSVSGEKGMYTAAIAAVVLW